MKRSFKTWLCALVLCIAMIFSVSCVNTSTGNNSTEDSGDDTEIAYPVNGSQKIVTDTITVYLSGDVSAEVAAAHYESTPEILLMDTETICSEFVTFISSLKGGFTFEETETTLKITRSNGASCVIDFVQDTIYYDNFDLFINLRGGAVADVLAQPYLDSAGSPIYFMETSYLNNMGSPLCIDLGARGLPLDIYEGKKYMAWQTFNDLFLSPFFYNFVYNGENLFLFAADTLDARLQSEIYSLEKTERSEAFANFSAKELCLLFDVLYGLPNEHGITEGFEAYLRNVGLWDDLTSTDPAKASAALLSLTYGVLVDKHSEVVSPSPLTGTPDMSGLEFTLDQTLRNFYAFMSELQAARAAAMPEGVPAYQEIGNTAYITFDAFTIDFALRGATYSEASLQGADTLGLIIYAHSQINREGSIIENVVVDLSCNGGGKADAAIYVVGWLLGYCNVHTVNSVTGCTSTVSYKVDVNLDGEFNDEDSVKDKNIYCLISPSSFSCGNLVPAFLKESGKVTLLGGKSAGGACMVQYGASADGTFFKFSSNRAFCTVTNGVYYNVDQGVEPHYYFGKLESYFDREALTDYINNLK